MQMIELMSKRYLCTRKRRRCPFSLVAYDLHGDVFVNGTLDLRWHPFSWWVISQCRQLAVFRQRSCVSTQVENTPGTASQGGVRAVWKRILCNKCIVSCGHRVVTNICMSDRNVYPKRKKPTDTYFCNINCLQLDTPKSFLCHYVQINCYGQLYQLLLISCSPCIWSSILFVQDITK